MNVHRRRLAFLISACLLIGCLAIVVDQSDRYFLSPLADEADWSFDDEFDEEEPFEMILDVPGVRLPAMLASAQATIPESWKVIGVIVNGQARAYLMDAMGMPTEIGSDMSAIGHHVVNDLIIDSAVSVTYCDLSECVRVFSKSSQVAPLALGVGGLSNDKMLLMYDGQRYEHGSADVPLGELPFTVTTWGRWRQANPTSTVYTGAH